MCIRDRYNRITFTYKNDITITLNFKSLDDNLGTFFNFEILICLLRWPNTMFSTYYCFKLTSSTITKHFIMFSQTIKFIKLYYRVQKWCPDITGYICCVSFLDYALFFNSFLISIKYEAIYIGYWYYTLISCFTAH